MDGDINVRGRHTDGYIDKYIVILKKTHGIYNVKKILVMKELIKT